MSKPAGIPLDIVEAARAVYAKLGRGITADEAVIAQALAAERERATTAERDRCAGVAQAYSDQAYRDGAKLSIEAKSLTDAVGAALTNALGDFSKDIAEAIRQGGAS